MCSKARLTLEYKMKQSKTEFWQENILVISNTLFQQPKRLLCRWTLPDSQYWNQIDYVLCVTCTLLWLSLCVLVAQLCLTLCDLIDYNLPCSPVPGILQARILEWVAILFSGDLPDSGIEPRSPALQADSSLSEPPVKSQLWLLLLNNFID